MSSYAMAIVDRGANGIALHGAHRPADTYVPGPLKESVRAPIRKGYLLILLFIGGFGAWASVAPLAGGAIAPGIISPNSSRRIVQHLEGGIIRDLRVHEGDVVKEGQSLLVLEPVQPKSAYETLLAQKQSLLAQKARLEAEKSGAATIAFPDELQPGGKLTAVAVSQQQMFDTRRSVQEVRKNLLKERTEQLAEQIKGSEAQIASLDTQLS
jgi:HlyD family secretion protein